MNEGLLTNYLIVGALLFAIGMIGFMARRNLIVMLLSAEMMFQGVSINLVAFNQYHQGRAAAGEASHWDGQAFALFVIAVAAAEAAIGLALVVVMFRRQGSLDVSVWQSLREAGQPPVLEAVAPEPIEPAIEWPRLPPAGVEPLQEGGQVSGIGGPGLVGWAEQGDAHGDGNTGHAARRAIALEGTQAAALMTRVAEEVDGGHSTRSAVSCEPAAEGGAGDSGLGDTGLRDAGWKEGGDA